MFKNLTSYIGPGILMAGAAVGVSHLVQSTRAGADFGFALIWIILLANLIKYPFFEFGSRYTAATGETLLDGYKKLGKPYLLAFMGCNIITATGSIAAIMYVTAALFANVMPFTLPVEIWAVIIMCICLALFISGHYSFVDRAVKVLMVVLVVSTVFAFTMALVNYTPEVKVENFISKEPWNLASLAFIIALMGWMPGPIEISTWQSLWMEAKTRGEGKAPTMKQALTDFNFGYILCVVLAILFLSLGALVMHGSGEEFTNGAVGFAGQVINLYTSSIGEWARPIIAIAAFTTMFSTTITLLDAYPRSLGYATNILLSGEQKNRSYQKYRWLWSVILYAAALVIIYAFTSGIKTLVDIVTIVAFIAAPIFAFLNMKLIFSKFTPDEAKPTGWLKYLTFFGLTILTLFAIGFIISKFL